MDAGVTSDKAPLQDDGSGPKAGPFGPSYGTLPDNKDMEMTPEDDPPRPPLRKRELLVGLLVLLVCVISASLTAPCLAQLGGGVVPTLQLMAMGYGIMTLCLLPLMAVCFRTFRQVTEDQLVWLLATGITISLSLLSGYQAALTLPGSVVVTLGLAIFLLLTFVMTWCYDQSGDRVFWIICLGSIAGLILMAASAIRNANIQGYRPLVTKAMEEDENTAGARDGVQTDDGAAVDINVGTMSPLDPSEEEDLDPTVPEGPVPSDSAEDNLLFAYCILLLSAFLGSLGISLIHRRLHNIHLPPFLFWLALVGTALATLEMALFSSPTWPPSSKLFPFVSFLVLFIAALLAMHTGLRLIEPTLFALLASMSAVFYLIMEHAFSSVMAMEPSDGVRVLDVIGAILITAAGIAGPIWIFRKVLLEQDN